MRGHSRGGDALTIGQSSRLRALYATSIAAACGLALAYLAWLVELSSGSSPWLLVAGAVVGILCGDFLSGLAHWACDTWGNARTPVVGPTLIQAFRNHHVDPDSICAHDWIEVNGEAALAACAKFGIGAPVASYLAKARAAEEDT